MEESVHQNWIKIKAAMEEVGDTECAFYSRACRCVVTQIDPGVPGYDEYYNHFLNFYNIV